MSTLKVAIGIGLSALRFDGMWGFNGYVFSPRKLPSSSPLRVASTTAWATSDDSLAQNHAANEKRHQKAKAPLVDSTLLRFMSSEKKNGAALLTGDAESVSPNGGNGRVEIDRQPFSPGDLMDGDATSLAVKFSFDQPVESQSWLGQYNTQKVSLKLQALGVNVPTAMKSGQIIQDYVLARVTRHRIRNFLQERDALWESGYSTPLVRKGIKESNSFAATSSFDLDGVIDVMTEYGLTGMDVASIFSHSPSVAMMRARAIENGSQIEVDDGLRRSYTLEETLDRVFGLLSDTLKLRRYDARKVLRASPGLLTSKGSVSAVQVVNLMVSLGSSTNSIARDKTSLPTLLCRSPALIFRLVAFLSSTQVQVPLSAIGPILRQKRSAKLLDAVAPVKCSISLDAFDITRKKTASLKVGNTMRQQKIEEGYRTIEAVLGVLRRSAGVKDFRKILSSHPDALFLNETNIHLMIQYLREDAGMTKGDIAKAIQTFPALLEEDVSKIKDVVKYLLTIEVDRDALPSILRSFPATLVLDIGKDMKPTISYLRGIGVRNVGRFVTRLPPVLGYSIEDEMKPKYDYLKQVCQFNYFEVVRFPAYFSYPLERVIKMRYEYLRDRKQIPIELARVDDVLRFGDTDFATEIALDDDGGEAFSNFVKERSRCCQPSTRQGTKKREKK